MPTDWSQYKPVKPEPSVDWSQFKPVAQGNEPGGQSGPMLNVLGEPMPQQLSDAYRASEAAAQHPPSLASRMLGGAADVASFMSGQPTPDSNRIIEGGAQGVGASLDNTAAWLGLAAAAPAMLGDKVHGLISGQPETGLQDYVFKHVVQPAYADAAYREKRGRELSPTAETVGQLGGDLIPAFLSRGESLEAAAPKTVQSIADMVREALPVATEISGQQGTRAAQQVIDAGGTGQQAQDAYGAAVAAGIPTNIVPVSLEGNLIKRGLSGGAAGAGAGYVQSEAEHLADPQHFKTPGWGDIASGSGFGSALALLLGHGGAAPHARAPDAANVKKVVGALHDAGFGKEADAAVAAEHAPKMDPVDFSHDKPLSKDDGDAQLDELLAGKPDQAPPIKTDVEPDETLTPSKVDVKDEGVIAPQVEAEQGPHGPVYHALNYKDAVNTLLASKTGEVKGALFNPHAGPVDLIYGKAGDPSNDFKDGYGLAKIEAKHPEVNLHALGDELLSAKPGPKHGNSWEFDAPNYKIILKRDWKGNKKTWLLTAFDPKEKSAPGGTRIDAATNDVGEARSPKGADDTSVRPQSPRIKNAPDGGDRVNQSPTYAQQPSGMRADEGAGAGESLSPNDPQSNQAHEQDSGLPADRLNTQVRPEHGGGELLPGDRHQQSSVDRNQAPEPKSGDQPERELVNEKRAADNQQTPASDEDAAHHESIAKGREDAERLGLRAAIRKVLGAVADKVEFLRGYDGLPDGLRESVKARNNLGRKGVTSALYDPKSKRVFIFTHVVKTPEKALWNAAHEIAGHEGLRALLGERLDPTLNIARQNPIVKALADEIYKQRKVAEQMRRSGKPESHGKLLATEEALAELAAAVRTGNFDRIAERYGVNADAVTKRSASKAVQNFLRRLKAMMDDLFGRHTFSDQDVRDLLEASWKAANGEHVSDGERTQLESTDEAQTDTFDPQNPSILEHVATADDMPHGERLVDTSADEKPVELPPRAPGESQKAYHARIVRENNRTLADGVRQFFGRPYGDEKRQRDIGRGDLRHMWAKNQRQMDRAHAAFRKAMAVFDTAGKKANLKAIHQWETGEHVTSAPHRIFFKAMEKAFNGRIDDIRELAPGSMQNLIENYFPHLWEDPTKAGKWYQSMLAKRPMEGNKSFMKQRIHATTQDGIASGLKPISTNPVDLVLAKVAQMDKFIAFNRFRQDLDERGWLKKMDAGERVPHGYARIDDAAFQRSAGLQGYYAVPEFIAKDVNNHLSPSLYRFRGFKAFRKIQNVIMMARLGWSAFHAGFTTLDNVVMHTDVAARYALHGDIKRSLTTLAKAPLSIVWSPIEGGRLNKQWLGLDKADANTAALLDALEQGGARYKMSSTDYNNDLPKFLRSLRQKDYKTSLKTSFSALGETGSWLIHHKLVPNQKMAARLLLAKFELDSVAGKLGKERGDYAGIIEAMHKDALRQIMGKVVNNVDDRLGQMNYDNQFWNKTAREVAQTAIGAVGWQVGTVRTVTGGVRDVSQLWAPEKLLGPLDKEGKLTDEHMSRVSGRLTYLLSLALMMGGTSAVTQYLLTGKGPRENKDYFFPRTGRKNADGSWERLQFPTYWMDHYKLATHPIQTMEHKVHPTFSMIMEALSNQDYYGAEIRDPNAPWHRQAEQVGEYVAKGFLPYSWSNSQKAAENNAGIGRQAASFVGVTDAPASVSRTPFQAYVARGGSKGWGSFTRTPEEATYHKKLRAAEDALRVGRTPDLSDLTPHDIRKIRRSVQTPVPEHEFAELGIQDKLEAYRRATPAERKEYDLRGMLLRNDPRRLVSFRRLPKDEQDSILNRLRAIRKTPPR